MAQKKEALKEIRTNLLTRGFSLARASLKVGGLAANSLFSTKETADKAWLGKVEFLVKELGQLKGTAMKVGQTLSMYGEHLLPKEVNDLLKTLQQNSPALAWPGIEAVLIKELGAERLAELEIEPDPVGAASIGQVHRARVRATGQTVAIKIQYPGVDKAVETDLKLLKFILNLTDLVPRGPRFDQIFDEIRVMFHQEIDYVQEADRAVEFADLLANDSRYYVPRPLPHFCTRRVLTTEFIVGHRVDAPEVHGLSLERRNAIGVAFMDLYLRELMEFRQMQTDPHLGNYMVQVGEKDGDDRLALFDFGAVREVPVNFLLNYARLVEGSLLGRDSLIEAGGRGLGLLLDGDSPALVTDYVNLCRLLTEPFDANQGAYDWGGSTLPKRVTTAVTKIASSYKMRAPPRELVFLDRKLGGVFIFLSVLKCKLEGRQLVLERLAEYHARESNPKTPAPDRA